MYKMYMYIHIYIYMYNVGTTLVPGTVFVGVTNSGTHALVGMYMYSNVLLLYHNDYQYHPLLLYMYMSSNVLLLYHNQGGK